MKFSRLTVTVTKSEAETIIAEHVRNTRELGTDAEVEVIIEQITPFSSNRAVLNRPLPPAAVFEITNGRNNKIAAIKELRAAWGLGLKEAKDIVELYCYIVLGGPKPF